MQNNTENQVYAGFFVRLAAYIIDWIIVGCVLLVVKFPLWIATVASPDNFIVKDFIFSYSVKDIVLYPAHLFHRSNIGKTCNAFAGCQQ